MKSRQFLSTLVSITHCTVISTIADVPLMFYVSIQNIARIENKIKSVEHKIMLKRFYYQIVNNKMLSITPIIKFQKQ